MNPSKLEKMTGALLEGLVTEEQVDEIFQAVIKLITESTNKVDSAQDEQNKAIEDFGAQISTIFENTTTSLESQQEAVDNMVALVEELKQQVAEMVLEDGEDADVSEAVEIVLNEIEPKLEAIKAMIPEIQEQEEMTAEEIRNKIASLVGDDRLSVRDLKDWDIIEADFSKRMSRIGHGSASSTATGGVSEGVDILSTGVATGWVLQADGDDTSSWVELAGGGNALTSNPLSQFAATTSAQLAGVISDETGSGALVFGTSPTLVTPALGTPSALVGTNITGLGAGAGALLDSEVTNLAQVKAFDSSDYATAAQGATADTALQNVVEDTTPQLGGNLDLNSNLLVFTPDATNPAYAEGQLFYDDNAKALAFDSDEPDVRLQIGQENWIYVRNNSGATISNGKAVYISGATGQNPTIALARSDSRSTSEVVGLATHDIENNSNGYVTDLGVVRDIDTSAFTDGDALYIDSSTAGELTATKPTGANYPVFIGTVAHAHVTQGKILVNPNTPLDTTDVVGAQIELTEGAFVDGDKTKLDGIEALADVTDTTNVTAAGALMDSELTSITDVKALNQSVVSGATPTFTTTNMTDATNKRFMSDAQETVLDNTSGTNTGDEATASTTVAGVVELATIAETDTGTDTTRALTSDGFQGSKRNIRWLTFNLVEAGTDCATATNIGGDFVSPIAGVIQQSDTTPFYLYATNSTAGTTGTMVVDISIGGTSIMTTNKLDFDTAEKTTTTASTPPDLTTTALAVGDIITIDIDSLHTTAKGLTVYMAVLES